MDIAGNEFNDYLNQLGLNSVGEKTTFKNNIITQYWQQSGAYVNTKVKGIWIKYSCFINNNKNFIIKDVAIYGDWNIITNIYLYYWKTNAHLSLAKNVDSYCNFLQDYITLKYDINTNQGKIIITNNTIKNTNQYEDIISRKATK